jgi:hypothetical protein
VQLALLGWFIALVMTLAGLVFALRQRLVPSAILIFAGLALGLVSGMELD